MQNPILKHATVNAVATAIYIVAVASFMSYVPKTFLADKQDTVFVPIFMLSLLVFSAALTGTLVFGRPVLWFLDGKKKEAVQLLGYTLAVFFALTVVAFLVLFLTR